MKRFLEDAGEPIDSVLAQHIEAKYVCSVCYGFLTVRGAGPFLAKVKCENENCQGGGFVTRAYAERRRSDSYFEMVDAQSNLRELFPDPQQNKTQAQILKELGY